MILQFLSLLHLLAPLAQPPVMTDIFTILFASLQIFTFLQFLSPPLLGVQQLLVPPLLSFLLPFSSFLPASFSEMVLAVGSMDFEGILENYAILSIRLN